jgi:hypothetical protein
MRHKSTCSVKDRYRGYEIDYSSEHEGYQVIKHGRICCVDNSYDGACEWIDKQHKERGNE